VDRRRHAIEFAHGRGVAPGLSARLALAIFLMASNACDRPADQRPAVRPAPVQPAPVQPAPVQTGVASYYAPELAGERTASGEPHDPAALTAASHSLPLGASAKVTNTQNGRSVTVEVNDRRPYAKRRILDVSPKAAEHLGFKDKGVAKVAVQPLPKR
jgi:rare lipoprotein A